MRNDIHSDASLYTYAPPSEWVENQPVRFCLHEINKEIIINYVAWTLIMQIRFSILPALTQGQRERERYCNGEDFARVHLYSWRKRRKKTRKIMSSGWVYFFPYRQLVHLALTYSLSVSFSNCSASFSQALMFINFCILARIWPINTHVYSHLISIYGKLC